MPFPGISIVFSKYLLRPIIIACVFYTKRGLIFSAVLAVLYFALILAFTRAPAVLLEASLRVLAFGLVAGVVTFLSSAHMRVEKTLRQQRDHLEDLVRIRTIWLEKRLS